jgi:hypothetical protein
MRGYDAWKTETPEDEVIARDRFMRKLLRDRYRDPDEAREDRADVLADYREECKADAERTGRRAW